ncbi:MAG: hypothetical protein HHJ17_09600 [Rhodoferax sp.]|uniref:EpsG family protein n=1 Tax=Rhodoferax sp. TaxID=50421 RepID=UPI0018472546|nr:EpsG family protein [Rhodoferax sp.]NMM13772.1 hypothetical protein [Rhodoferax sp.]
MNGNIFNATVLKNRSFGKYEIATLSVCVFVFLLSLLISPYYIYGDQNSYKNTYDGISNLSLLEGFYFYNSNLGSQELVHYFITWLASGAGFDKDLIMAMSNSLLAYLSMKFFEKLKVSVFVASVITSSNFYYFVLYFAAERLKFGFIFLFISLLVKNNKKLFLLSAVLAVLSHVQVLLIYVSMFFIRIGSSLLKFYKAFNVVFIDIFSLVFLLLLSLLLFLFLGDHMYSKYEYYYDIAAQKNLADLFVVSVLAILSFWYAKSKIQSIFVFIPVILAVFFVGSDRINMMAYFIFLYYGLKNNNGLNFGVIGTVIYFAFKSFLFIYCIIEYGDGFNNNISSINSLFS